MFLEPAHPIKYSLQMQPDWILCSEVNWEEKLQNQSLKELWSTIKGYITEATKTYVPHFFLLETGRHHDGKNHLGWINTPWQHSKKKEKAYGILFKK